MVMTMDLLETLKVGILNVMYNNCLSSKDRKATSQKINYSRHLFISSTIKFPSVLIILFLIQHFYVIEKLCSISAQL